MRITIDGISTVINRLRQLPDEIERRTRVFLERLAEIGIAEAEVGFSRVAYDGDNDVTVNPAPEWENDHTLRIVASGTAVLFVEFGAGVFNPPYPAETPPEILPRGTYGKGYGKRKAWGFYTDTGELVITHGNAPARAMFDAGQRIRKEIVNVAKEVFGSD